MDKKNFYKMLRLVKKYYDNKNNRMRDDAPEEAIEAFKQINKLLPELPPVEDQPIDWVSPYK